MNDVGKERRLIGHLSYILDEAVGGPHDGYCDRYATREEALRGHQNALDMINEDGA